MKEISNIIGAYEIALQGNRRMALATVVQVEGSSYRRPGARMLITDDGRLTGAISGGCLEGDALRKALLVMSREESMLVTYDTTDEDDASIGVQLGCNGIVHILIEPINIADQFNPIELLKKVRAERGAAVLVTVFSLKGRSCAQLGTCLFLRDEVILHRIVDDELAALIAADARLAWEARSSFIRNYSSFHGVTASFAYTEPSISLALFGAGNDAVPLAQIADVLGWEVSVVDGRYNYATAERFPSVAKVKVAKAENALEGRTWDEYTAAVIMSHNYHYDFLVLKQLLPLKLKYIGCLGPKKKLERMLQELRSEGLAFSQKELSSVFGPTGLDIGSETPEEIALSIIAEVKSVVSERCAVSLRDKPVSIHESLPA